MPRLPDAGQMLASINRWVAVESKTEDCTAVNRMMELAEEACRESGLECSRVATPDEYGDCLRACMPGDSGDAQGILALSHLDTVHPAGTLARNPIRTEGDRAYGPGIYDMKGGAWLTITALAAAREETGTRLPVRLLFVSEEEIGSPVSRALIESEARMARYVLVAEPARDGGRLVTGRKGTLRMEMIAHGKPTHSGMRHEDGRSAVLEIARQIIALESMTDYGRGITVNVGTVQGGTGVNVVPGECRIGIDVRMTNTTDAGELCARIRALRPTDPEISLEISGGMGRPPWVKTPAVAALFEHARSEARKLGFDIADGFTGGGSDGNFTAAMGIPTLDGLGVDGAGAHTLEEHLLVSSLVPRGSLLARLYSTLN